MPSAYNYDIRPHRGFGGSAPVLLFIRKQKFTKVSKSGICVVQISNTHHGKKKIDFTP